MSIRAGKQATVQKRFRQHEEIATYMIGSWENIHRKNASTWYQDAPNAPNVPIANFKPFDLNKLL